MFDIDLQRCPNCGAGQFQTIAAIPQRPVIEKILAHLGLDPQPPPKGRAREAGPRRAAAEGHGGAVTPVQRFRSVANLNIRLHRLLLDGMYGCGADDVPVFVYAGAPSDDELHALLHTVIARLIRPCVFGLSEPRTRVNPGCRSASRRHNFLSSRGAGQISAH